MDENQKPVPVVAPVPKAPSAPITPKVLNKVIQVRAVEDGWYNNQRIKAGDKFSISSEKHFSEIWMEKLK